TYYYKVSAVNDNPGEGPLSPAVSGTVPAAGTGTLLSHATWADGEINPAGEVEWYKFTVTAAGDYYVQWDDAINSLGGKTLNFARVAAYRHSDGTPLFSNRDSGYTYAPSVSLTANETVYIRVEGVGGYATGTYAVQYYQQ
ncbi:MAG: fibronectin type III domain-containing protein, partial [Treponema sp.]|nr:fibronectin type III domain-containing protein [Treponema sp.]